MANRVTGSDTKLILIRRLSEDEHQQLVLHTRDKPLVTRRNISRDLHLSDMDCWSIAGLALLLLAIISISET